MIDDFVYGIYPFAPPIQCGAEIYVIVGVKPLVSGNVFWNVFQREGTARMNVVLCEIAEGNFQEATRLTKKAMEKDLICSVRSSLECKQNDVNYRL